MVRFQHMNFNSIKVRLERTINSYLSDCLPDHFNSIKVRLEQGSNNQRVNSLTDFNSIKVRLERRECRRLRAGGSRFQFHKGTIRTILSFKNFLCKILFQFNKGTIRTFTCVSFRRASMLFQFHKGTIRTLLRLLRASLLTMISIP